MSQAEADAAAASAQRAAESQRRAEAQGMVDRAIAVAKAQLAFCNGSEGMASSRL